MISWISRRLMRKQSQRSTESGTVQHSNTNGYRRAEIDGGGRNGEEEEGGPGGGTNAPLRLPWGVVRDRPCYPESVSINTQNKPGEFILQTLFAEFTVLAARKVDVVLDPANRDKTISKLLQRSEDPSLDQLLTSLGAVAENCLPSLLRTLFEWYDRQNPMDEAGNCLYRRTNKLKGEKEFLCERRDLAVDFMYCLVLIEVLKQLQFHPGHDELINHIISLAFRHFKYKEGSQTSPNVSNINIVADLYAEVIGVLVQSRFGAVKKRFMYELKELRSREMTPHTAQCIISLLMGMKFFRVKMAPIEDFQACIQFLHECGQYFLEIKDRDKEIKHALAGLFVEILLPVAAVAKNEVNVPVLKTFVDTMYVPTIDLANRRKHHLALFPMVTCLLCVSQKQFFINNWPTFLNQCLSKLKDRDPTTARVALESLYRLLWVYVIRIKCESNTATASRLQSIVSSLFPKGSKVIMPKDAPLSIFVKIIQFIAQERLDFAMKEIIFDLLSVGKPIKTFFAPERMCIGLRAFLVIADGLQQKEGEPPMPQTMGVPPSGSTLRFKKTFINKYLSEQTARNIGLTQYYCHVCKTFDSLLRYLDAQVGRPMLLIRSDIINREPDDIITGERKPKIDLFRTCVAALPRLLPDGMTQHELIELLSRLTVHMDDELGKLAFQSLQNITADLPEWRSDVFHGFVQFIQREVTDSFPQLLELCHRRLITLLTQWKSAASASNQQQQQQQQQLQQLAAGKDRPAASAGAERNVPSSGNTAADKPRADDVTESSNHPLLHPGTPQLSQHGRASQQVQQQAQRMAGGVGPAVGEVEKSRGTLHLVEGLALVMLCSCKPTIRKQALVVLKEVRQLYAILNLVKDQTDLPVLDMMDKACPLIVERVLPHLPGPERTAALSANTVDFQWLSERTSIIWTSSSTYPLPPPSDGSTSSLPLLSSSTNIATATITNDSVLLMSVAVSDGGEQYEAWLETVVIFMSREFVTGHCSTAVQHAWPFLYARLHTLFPLVDPTSVAGGERTSSLLRRKVTSERDHLSLWKNYLVMGCCLAPPSYHHGTDHFTRCVSPEPTLSSPDTPERFDVGSSRPVSPGQTSRELFKNIVPQIKCDVSEMRDTVVLGLGNINPLSFRYLLEEQSFITSIKEAIDRKTENVKRKKRRDFLRLALVRIFNTQAENGLFCLPSAEVINLHTEALSTTFVEYIDGARLFLEQEADKDQPITNDIRLYFSRFIYNLIRNTPVARRHKLLSQDLRANLCILFARWGGKFGLSFSSSDRRHVKRSDLYSELELASLQACAASLCCGTVYDPSGLNEDGYIYYWLNKLLATKDVKIYRLVQETIVLLLEFNQDAQTLLEWVIDRCYTGSKEIADCCFTSLAIVFNDREYPCDQVAMLNLTLLKVGCPRAHIHEAAIHLLHILYKRFFMDGLYLERERERDGKALAEDRRLMREALFTGPGCRSQLALSGNLASLHPDLTMPIFSEIMHRLKSAQYAVRQNLLHYVLPWLYNMELVDPNIQPSCAPPASRPEEDRPPSVEFIRPALKGKGWGSPEATNLILNNLLYTTLTLGDDFNKEVGDLWAALVSYWPANLSVIMRYLVVTVGMYPQVLLPAAKKIAIYLYQARSDKLVDELMNELRTIEPLHFNVERIETPPFYRLGRRQMLGTAGVNSGEDGSGNSSTGLSAGGDGESPRSATHTPQQQRLLDRGQIHTKRHSGEDMSRLAHYEPSVVSTATAATGSIVMTARVGGGQAGRGAPEQSDGGLTSEMLPHPLPMPAYGGYYAPLSDYLPSGPLPNPPYQRCNIAVMLLTDVVLDSGAQVDWTMHLPLMLHIIFLGLDNPRPAVNGNCKKLLLNLLLAFSAHKDHFVAAKTIISKMTVNEEKCLMPLEQRQQQLCHHGGPSSSAADHAGAKSKRVSEVSFSGIHQMSSQVSVTQQLESLTTDSMAGLAPVESYQSADQCALALVEFITTRKCRPLWNYEDITSKVHRIRSAEHMELLLGNVLRVFRELLPSAHIEQRWSQEAVHLSLSCSSRHYAGRSFQIFRALHVSLNPSDLCDILSRLVETVAEPGEDMQGYVTEIMLTLEAAVDTLDVEVRPIQRDLFMSTPNLAKDVRPEPSRSGVDVRTPVQSPARSDPHSKAEARKSTIGIPSPPTSSSGVGGSVGGATPSNEICSGAAPLRSSSAGTSAISAGSHVSQPKNVVSSPPIMDYKDGRSQARRHLSGEATDIKPPHSPPGNLLMAGSVGTYLLRSHSTQSLRHIQDLNTYDDRLALLTQMLFISISLMESDFEYEFLMALRLASKVLRHFQPDRPDCRDKVSKVLQVINWPQFPGIQSLMLKGLTSNLTAEPTWLLLSSLTPYVSTTIVDPSSDHGLALNVMALLPHLVEHYEDPTKFCTEAAGRIADACTRQAGARLENLASVMIMYSRKSFAKDCFQWSKCVVRYLFDVYNGMYDIMIGFLAEVLDKGPSSTQGAVLQILHCIVQNVDINTVSTQAINGDLLRVVARYVENAHHGKEASAIIKLCVTRSSTLVAAPPPSSRTTTVSMDASGLGQVIVKKELPGRTIDFKFDHSQIPIIGLKYWDIQTSTSSVGSGETDSGPSRHTSSASSRQTDSGMHRPTDTGSTGTSSYEGTVSSWRRPLASQARTRDRLVNLLNCYGPRVIPKSPSVIFDPQSPAGTLEREASATLGSSSEETSTIDGHLTGELGGSSVCAGGYGTGTDSVERQIASVFDFLEEPDNGCEYWGVTQRHTLSVDDGAEEEGLMMGGGGGVIGSSGLIGRPGSAVGVRYDEHKDSSDDETQSVSPMEEFPPSGSQHSASTEPTITLDQVARSSSSTALITSSPVRRSTSGSNLSIHSASTDLDTMAADLGELSPSHISPSYSASSNAALAAGGAGPGPEDLICEGVGGGGVPPSTSEADAAWKAHVNRVIRDGYSADCPSTFSLFVKLFRETRDHLTQITSEVHQNLCRHNDASFSDLANQLSGLESMTSEIDCPLVLTDLTAMISSKVLDKHRYMLLEINEGYETFLMRRDQVLDLLTDVHAVERRTAVSAAIDTSAECTVSLVALQQRLRLVQSVYRLHFQLLQWLDCYGKLVSHYLHATKHLQQLTDLSIDITELYTELRTIRIPADSDESDAIATVAGSDVAMATSPTDAELARSVVECVNAHKYTWALRRARQYNRSVIGGEVSRPLTSDIDTVLYLYCKHLTNSKPGYLAVCQPAEQDLSQLYGNLMEIKVQVSNALALHGVDTRGRLVMCPERHLTLSAKGSDSSTL